MKSANWGSKLRMLLGIAAMACSLGLVAQDAPQPSGNATASAKPAEDPKPASPDTKPLPKPAKGSVANDSDYVIGTDDVLFVNVWREAEMSRAVPVRPDGKISLPLIGEFEAAGQTPKQLESIMTNPEVTIIVQEMRSQKFTIMGEVGKPGSYPLQKPMSVLEGLAMAGGPKDYAKLKKIYVLRRNADGTVTKLPFNYKEALKGDSKQNIELEARDTIVVP